jgi:hypothetical protein
MVRGMKVRGCLTFILEILYTLLYYFNLLVFGGMIGFLTLEAFPENIEHAVECFLVFLVTAFMSGYLMWEKELDHHVMEWIEIVMDVVHQFIYLFVCWLFIRSRVERISWKEYYRREKERAVHISLKI